jgi:hypothetical protein
MENREYQSDLLRVAAGGVDPQILKDYADKYGLDVFNFVDSEGCFFLLFFFFSFLLLPSPLSFFFLPLQETLRYIWRVTEADERWCRRWWKTEPN